jgi:hypothetical protein
MAPKVHKIHSLPDDAPWDKAVPPAGSAEHPMMVRGLDRVLSIQRPLVLAHIRSIRLRNPQASPTEIIRILERRYLAAVTTGGAAVGATAVVPGIGTGVTLALSGVETVGFVESTALFAQSVAEVHGIAVANPARARALVMTLMLGKEGVDLVGQLAGQVAGRGGSRSSYWGELVTKSLPRAAVGPLVDQLKSMFVKQFAAKGGASVIGKALPFGIGAAIGGAGNHILGRRVLTTSHRAFGARRWICRSSSNLYPEPRSWRCGCCAVRATPATRWPALRAPRSAVWSGQDARLSPSDVARRPTRRWSRTPSRTERTARRLPKDHATRCAEHPTDRPTRR